jgi:hypothetical protein
LALKPLPPSFFTDARQASDSETTSSDGGDEMAHGAILLRARVSFDRLVAGRPSPIIPGPPPATTI